MGYQMVSTKNSSNINGKINNNRIGHINNERDKILFYD